MLLAAEPVRAQILGNATPGTPGAIEGELRAPRMPGLPPVITPQGAVVEGRQRPGKYTLRKTVNPAVRGTSNANPMTTGGVPRSGAPGSQRFQSQTRAPRAPGDLTGVTLADTIVRPVTDIGPAPGLSPYVAPRARRQAPEADPYAPVGIRAGTILLRPAIEVGAGYDTNASRSPTTARGAAVYRATGELQASSDWTQHRLDLDLRGTYTGYTSLQNVSRPEGDARIALRLDATRDLSFDTELRSRIDTETASSVNLPGGIQGRTPFYTHGAALGATHRFGRLSIGLRGTLDRTIYGDASATGGGIVDQSSRNLYGYGARLRAGYELSPGISPFIEAGIDRRSYDSAVDSSGFRRSSQGSALRIGSTFELARTLTGEAAAGYTMRAYEDARLANLKAPTLDAALTWSISPLTTLNMRAQTELGETTVAGSSGAVIYRGTATLTHAFLRNFTAAATLGVSQSDYQKIARAETTLTGGLRLEYKFNRLMALRATYQYEQTRVNVPNESYSAQTLLLGLRLTP